MYHYLSHPQCLHRSLESYIVRHTKGPEFNVSFLYLNLSICCLCPYANQYIIKWWKVTSIARRVLWRFPPHLTLVWYFGFFSDTLAIFTTLVYGITMPVGICDWLTIAVIPILQTSIQLFTLFSALGPLFCALVREEAIFAVCKRAQTRVLH